MNRKQRRAAKAAPKISEIGEDERKVLMSLIKYWLTESVAGQAVVEQIGMDEAIQAVCNLRDRGLVRFVGGPERLDGTFPFSVESTLPAGGRA
jgi:hypothetical protein